MRSGSADELGLTGAAIKEEKQQQGERKRGEVKGKGAKKPPRHTVDIRGLLNTAIRDASESVDNVTIILFGSIVWGMIISSLTATAGRPSVKAHRWVCWL